MVRFDELEAGEEIVNGFSPYFLFGIEGKVIV